MQKAGMQPGPRVKHFGLSAPEPLAGADLLFSKCPQIPHDGQGCLAVKFRLNGNVFIAE
jgi:hypothetical protein